MSFPNSFWSLLRQSHNANHSQSNTARSLQSGFLSWLVRSPELAMGVVVVGAGNGVGMSQMSVSMCRLNNAEFEDQTLSIPNVSYLAPCLVLPLEFQSALPWFWLLSVHRWFPNMNSILLISELGAHASSLFSTEPMWNSHGPFQCATYMWWN